MVSRFDQQSALRVTRLIVPRARARSRRTVIFYTRDESLVQRYSQKDTRDPRDPRPQQNFSAVKAAVGRCISAECIGRIQETRDEITMSQLPVRTIALALLADCLRASRAARISYVRRRAKRQMAQKKSERIGGNVAAGDRDGTARRDKGKKRGKAGIEERVSVEARILP